MLRCLLVLTAIALAIAWLSPALRESALQALDSSVLCGLGGLGTEEETEDAKEEDTAPFQRRREGREVSCSWSAAATSTKRRRVTPFQAKMVAASQDWRCGCGCRDPEDARGRGYQLDANFEIDHRIPTRWGGKHDKSNWVAVLRAHHAIKSARESSLSARRGR